MKSKTLTITIDCVPAKVYRFVSSPVNLPKWASTFIQSAKKEGSDWVVETAQGLMKVRFAEANTLGVLDITLTPDGGREIIVPLRVIRNDDGAEVTFTIFQWPGLSDEAFTKDAEAVAKDLASLKAVLEKD